MVDKHNNNYLVDKNEDENTIIITLPTKRYCTRRVMYCVCWNHHWLEP